MLLATCADFVQNVMQMYIFTGLYAHENCACQHSQWDRRVWHKMNKLYLHTVKLVCDPGHVLDFEQGAQVPCTVVQLDLKTFVAKRHFTVQKQNTRIEEMGQNSGAKKKNTHNCYIYNKSLVCNGVRYILISIQLMTVLRVKRYAFIIYILREPHYIRQNNHFIN